MKTQTRKKNRRDRRDGWYLDNLDSLHVIMPFSFPRRCDNEAVLGEVLDMTEIDKFLAEKNAQNPDFKYTWFHVISAILAKTLMLRPKMNYFISGYRMYERKNIELAFNVKRKFEDNAEEAMAKFVLDKDGGSVIEQVHSYVRDFVTTVRVHDKTVGITNSFNFLQHLPRFVLRFIVWVLRRLEYHGLYPKGMQKDDPAYSSIYISNLGSIKMNADYHHLFQWGTMSFFVVIGEKKMRPFFKEDGSYELRNTIKVGITIDERIADGYYFAKTLRLVRYLCQHPELLELDAVAPIDFEEKK